MTQRERKEARIQKRLDWAAGRDKKARGAFDGDSRNLGQNVQDVSLFVG